METAVRAGADGIEHALAVGAEETEFSPELLGMLAARGTVVDPTMISILRWERQVPGALPVYEKLRAAVRRMYEAGVTLADGRIVDGNRRFTLSYLDGACGENSVHWIAVEDGRVAGYVFLDRADRGIPWLGIAVREEWK